MTPSVGFFLIQAAGEAAGSHGGGFEPFLPGLIVLLPFLGFVINGALALISARRGADLVRSGADESEHHGPSGPKPATHSLPTFVGPGVVLLAFLIVLVNFTRMLGAELHEPVIQTYWTWMGTGTFEVAADPRRGGGTTIGGR